MQAARQLGEKVRCTSCSYIKLNTNLLHQVLLANAEAFSVQEQ
jgi:hypothetical protein